MRIIPKLSVITKAASKRGLITFASMTNEGKLSAVTLIKKLSTVPSPAPFSKSARATGIAAKVSAYIGIPTTQASSTLYHKSAPSTLSTRFWGKRLWIKEPIATPSKI